MKTIPLILLAMLILGGCRQDEECGVPKGDDGPNGEGTPVVLGFTGVNEIDTRAYGTAAATAAEKKVISAKFFVFNSSNNNVYERLLTGSELANVGTATPISFNVPGLAASTSYNCYVVINKGNVQATTLAALKGLPKEGDIALYNGAWNKVADTVSSPLRSGGFVMQGSNALTTGADLTQPQPLSVTVKRVTAKIDIGTIISTSVFGPGNTYPGTLVIDSVKLMRTQDSTALIPPVSPVTTTGARTLGKQLPNYDSGSLTYQNRFYVFENGSLSAGSRVLLVLYGTYTDLYSAKSLVSYNAELTGTGTNGSIVRNGAYKVNATINGLTGTQINVTISVADWETLVSQSVGLGGL